MLIDTKSWSRQKLVTVVVVIDLFLMLSLVLASSIYSSQQGHEDERHTELVIHAFQSVAPNGSDVVDKPKLIKLMPEIMGKAGGNREALYWAAVISANLIPGTTEAENARAAFCRSDRTYLDVFSDVLATLLSTGGYVGKKLCAAKSLL